MSNVKNDSARAVADLTEGFILASVEILAPPERVFRALASKDIVDWWVRAGVFRMTDWTGDVRVGGKWRGEGDGARGHFVLEGEFLEVDSPRKLVHTWHLAGAPGAPTVVTYLLQAIDGGTRVTLRHTGFAPPESCATTSAAWETSFRALVEHLAARAA